MSLELLLYKIPLLVVLFSFLAYHFKIGKQNPKAKFENKVEITFSLDALLKAPLFLLNRVCVIRKSCLDLFLLPIFLFGASISQFFLNRILRNEFTCSASV